MGSQSEMPKCQVTVVGLNDEIWSSEVDSKNLDIGTLKMLFCTENNLDPNDMVLSKNNQLFRDELQTLDGAGIKNGDMIMAVHADMLQYGSAGPSNSSRSRQSSSSTTGQPDFEASARQLIESCRNDRQKRNQYLNTWKEMGEAIDAGNVKKVSQLLQNDYNSKMEDKQKLENALKNPTAPENRKIVEAFQKQQKIDESLEQCMEENPEMFGQVIMLYINCQINGHSVKAFVDSGAQMTIMSSECARKCGLTDLIDVRFSGIAQGVGTQKILGRIHTAYVQIGNDCLSSTFSVIENQPMGVIIGLDLLKRHQCQIDLLGNKLIIGTTRSSTPFLSESELPKHARLTQVPSTSNSLEDIEDSDEIQRAIQASKMDQSSRSLPHTPPQQQKIKALKSMIKCNDSYAAELLEETDWDPNAAALKYLTSAMAHSPNNSPTAPTGSARPRKRSKHS